MSENTQACQVFFVPACEEGWFSQSKMQKIFVSFKLKEAILVLATGEQISGYIGILIQCNIRVTCPGGHTTNTYIQVQMHSFMYPKGAFGLCLWVLIVCPPGQLIFRELSLVIFRHAHSPKSEAHELGGVTQRSAPLTSLIVAIC